MRARIFSAAALAVLAAFTALAARGEDDRPTEKAGDNLFAGGSFEGDSLNAEWKWNDNGGTFSASKVPGRTGTAAALVSTGTEGRAKFFAKGFNVPAGADIRVSLWAKAEDLQGGVWVNYEGQAGEGFAKFDLAGGTYDWTRYVHRTTVPDKGFQKGQMVRLELWFYVYGKGRLLLDDVECRVIEPTDAAKQAASGPADQALKALSSRLTKSQDWEVRATEPARRVLRDRPFTGAPLAEVAVDICRGEFEGAQVLVFAQGADLNDVEVSAGDLKGPATIAASNVQVLPVAYCDRSGAPPVPWYDGQTSAWWPDPLVDSRKFKVEKGTVQPVYLRFRCPKDAKPGEYKGAVEVKSSAGTATIPVKLTVWDVEMPVRLRFKSMLIAGKADQPHLDLALEQRLPLGNIAVGLGWAKPNFPAKGDSFDFSEVEKKLQYSIDRGMNAFIMAMVPKAGKWGFPNDYSPEWKATMSKVVTEYAKFLKSKGWSDMALFYNIDEPPKSLWDKCRDMHKLAKAADPQVRVIQCLNELGAADYLKGSADVWDLYVQQYHEQQGQVRQAAGDEIWWAICIWPGEHPNLFTEYPLTDARVIGWAAFKYGVSGFEYWSLTSWEEANPKDAAWITCPGGVLTTAWKLTRGRSGDGYLVYPGPDGKPVNSLRFEALRDGFEENELLQMLKAKLPALTGAVKAEAEKLLDGGDGLVTNMFIYSNDPAEFAKRRRRVFEILAGKAR